MRPAQLVGLAVLSCGLAAAQADKVPSRVLPAPATTRLTQSLAAAAAHSRHVWRDTPPLNEDGTVNAFVEIPRGDRRKWEFDMRANRRAIDRIIPKDLGGYPVNYGFVPQTVSYDGDPFDALVLGPPAAGGEVVRGAIVGLMFMEDEKGSDAKVVLSPVGSDRRQVHALTEADRRVLGDYFNKYKRHEPGAYARVPGWGSPAEALEHVQTTHAFFLRCRQTTGTACEIR